MKYLMAIFTIVFLSNSVVAQEHKQSYGDWSVYTINEDGRKLCYATSFPIRKAGNYRHRSKPYAMVTVIENGGDEFSVTGGYKYKDGTEPRIQIDRNIYKISLTQGEIAWAKTDQYDRLLISRMKKGWKMKVTGTSVLGTYSIDTYSLKGFTDAYNRVKRLCNGDSA